MTELTMQQKETLRQLKQVPKNIPLRNNWSVRITDNHEEMLSRPQPIKKYASGKCLLSKNEIVLFPSVDIGENALHEILHAIIFESGIKNKFVGCEEEMLVRCLVDGIKSYLNACQVHSQKMEIENE
jgi:hypothetical protein